MEDAVSKADYRRKLDELDRLLNDPDVPMQPQRVWTLLAEISHHDLDHAPEGAGLAAELT